MKPRNRCVHLVQATSWCPELKIASPSYQTCFECDLWKDSGEPRYDAPRVLPDGRGIGLGDVVAGAIAVATLGQGKRLAKAYARMRRRKSCGCRKRQVALNRQSAAKSTG